MNINRIIIVPLVSLLVAGMAGCETPNKPAVNLTTIKCIVPTIAALRETKESQEKGGVEIAIVPALYKAARADKRELQPAQPPSDLSTIIGPGHVGQVYVQETVTPRLVAQPDRLEFTVRVNNKLDRVFRGQGAVVQFNVGGKLIPFDQTNYRNFINGIVPPRNETEFKIYGPALNLLPEKGTIGIFLYDVVTATDVTGKVTEKQNFEWYFNCAMQEAQDSAQATVKAGWINQVDYQAYHRNLILEQQ